LTHFPVLHHGSCWTAPESRPEEEGRGSRGALRGDLSPVLLREAQSKTIVRRLGVARNAVRHAVPSDHPPFHQQRSRG